MKKIIILLCLSFLFSLVGNAQILNIEQFRLEKDTFNVWYGNISLGISARKQGSEIRKIEGVGNAVYLSKKHSYMSLNRYSFLQINKSSVISEGYAHTRITFNRKKVICYEQFNQFQYDIARKLNQRILSGMAVRFRLIAKKKNRLSANTGFMYENENWQVSDSTTMNNISIKSTSNFNYRVNLHKKILFYCIAYYQAKPDNFFKPRVTVDTSLQFLFTKNFSFNTSLVSTYDRDYIVPIAELIYNFSSTISYTF